MAELPEKQRRHPGSRGLRGRGRTRPADGGQNASSGGQNSNRNTGGGPTGQQAGGNTQHQQRGTNGTRANPQSNRRHKKPGNKQGKPGGNSQQLDSESDFRAFRQAGGQRHSNGFADDLLLGSSANNGNRNRSNGRRQDGPVSGNRRQGKTSHNGGHQNGNHWSPSDPGGYTGMQQLRGSDWYREDQARYAAKQIASENPESDGDDSTRKKGPRQGAQGGNKRANGQRGRHRRNNNNNRPATNQRNQAGAGKQPVSGSGDAPATDKQTTVETRATNNEAQSATTATNSDSPARRPAKRKPRTNSRSNATKSAANGQTQTNEAQTKVPQVNKATAKNSSASGDNGVENGTSAPAKKVQRSEQDDTTGRENGKARRAPWRTQKHGAGRKGESST